MAAENLEHNEGVYALAIQLGDYRRACWVALRSLRHIGKTDLWTMRLNGALKRRAS
jgi:hypothetical protein